MGDIKRIADLLEKSRYTVAICGVEMSEESGYTELRRGKMSYEIEQEYGYSFEEILQPRFFTMQTEEYYDFYRKYIISQLDQEPGECFKSLAKLEELGYMNTVITKRVFGLPGRAGCRNVIDLYGNVLTYHCQRCATEYDLEYIRKTTGVPLCEKCGSPIRPDAKFYGEMVDNNVMTHACEEIGKADILMILGTNLGTDICRRFVKYYNGNKLILIKNDRHYTDKHADVEIYSKVTPLLTGVVKELAARRMHEVSIQSDGKLA